MSIRETTIWRKLFLVPTDEFLRNVVNRVNLPGLERVVIRVHEGTEGDEPVFLVEYEATGGGKVLMRAKDRVSAAEYRAALAANDSDVHQDVEGVLKSWVDSKVKDVESKLLEAGVSVEIVTSQ